MSSPRQRETVWLLRIKLCNVAWADVIVPSCPKKANTPPHIPPLRALPPPLILTESDIYLTLCKADCLASLAENFLCQVNFPPLISWYDLLLYQASASVSTREEVGAEPPLILYWWTIRNELLKLHAKASFLWHLSRCCCLMTWSLPTFPLWWLQHLLDDVLKHVRI